VILPERYFVHLWNGTIDPVGTSITSYIVNSVRTLNADLSFRFHNNSPSQNITVGGSNTAAVFSGLGFMILYTELAVLLPAKHSSQVELPTGLVTVLGLYIYSAYVKTGPDGESQNLIIMIIVCFM